MHSMVMALLMITGATLLASGPPGWILALAIISAIAVAVAMASVLYCLMKFFVINEKYKDLFNALKRAFFIRPNESILHYLGRVIVNGLTTAAAITLFVLMSIVSFGMAVDKGFQAFTQIMQMDPLSTRLGLSVMW